MPRHSAIRRWSRNPQTPCQLSLTNFRLCRLEEPEGECDYVRIQGRTPINISQLINTGPLLFFLLCSGVYFQLVSASTPSPRQRQNVPPHPLSPPPPPRRLAVMLMRQQEQLHRCSCCLRVASVVPGLVSLRLRAQPQLLTPRDAVGHMVCLVEKRHACNRCTPLPNEETHPRVLIPRDHELCDA